MQTAKIYHKLKGWIKRYLPAEISGTIVALLAASSTFVLTNNTIITAFAGTWGENLGYYGTVFIRDTASSKKYDRIAFVKNIRNLILEFGFSESLDSFFIRPFFMYLFTTIIGNVLLGIFVGKLTADITFYIPTIIAYEFRKKYLRD